MPIIDCTDLSKSYSHVPILSDVSLTIRTGERVGLVGNNGSGKTTLGRILAGGEEPDGGSVARRRGAHIDYLPQEPSLPQGEPVSAVVLSSLAAWNEAKETYDRLTTALSDPDGGDFASTSRFILPPIAWTNASS